MKKLTLAVSLLALSISLPAQAAESVAGGLEFSGNASILTGWQHDDSKAIPTLGGEFALIRGLRAPNRDTFNFYVDQIELDLEKSFGEKIRLRVDLDFGRLLSGSGRSTAEVVGLPANFIIEQAYVTLGILGGEFLIGRFNAPVGYYVVDRAFNPTISFSTIYQQLTPTNVTGAKMYWAFGDNLDLQVYIMNNMFDCLFTPGCLVGPSVSGISGDSAIPSWGMRFGFNWGEDDMASTVGLSYLGGPEQPGNNAHLTHLLDLDLAIKLTESLLIAGEGIYFQNNNLPGVLGPNAKYMGGLLVLDWQATDIWDIFFSFGYTNDLQGFVTGADMAVWNFVLGFGYQITDGAKFKMEYRADIFDYAAALGTQALVAPVAGASTTSLSHGVAGEFAYTF